jgi:hypothetical protein
LAALAELDRSRMAVEHAVAETAYHRA